MPRKYIPYRDLVQYLLNELRLTADSLEKALDGGKSPDELLVMLQQRHQVYVSMHLRAIRKVRSNARNKSAK